MVNKKCLNCGKEQYIAVDDNYYVAAYFCYLFYQQFIFYEILGQSDRTLDLLGLFTFTLIGFNYLSIEHKPRSKWVRDSINLNFKKIFPIFLWCNGILISEAYIYRFLNY
ncbi:MAG: hypothetical protein GQ583_06475 [Methyloprofundus sp.]|nr:hypothetical protein [Methyloprofundus sp.]